MTMTRLLILGALIITLSACSFKQSSLSIPPASPTGRLQVTRAVEAPKFNTEAYDHIVDNPFVRVSQDPLATFSIDVDTASYANMRRFLNANRLPPKDSVRIEELLNYFTYDYSTPQGNSPLALNAEVAAAPWKPEHRLVRIGIKGKELDVEQQKTSNLVFLIDVSGSMDSPEKLPLLKNAMKLLVDRLGENDRVAIVVYAGSEGLALPSTTGDKKEVLVEAIETLRPGGATNGAAGIRLAYNTAVANFIPGGINRVILATDGDFNVGISSEGDLIRLIQEQARSGVFLTVLGFGKGNLQDAKLEKLADNGNGNYAYIDTLNEGRKVLVEQMGGTLVTIAKDVKIQVEFNPAEVIAYRLIGYENRVLRHEDFNDDQKDAGDIGAGHTVTALFEVVPRGVAIDIPSVDPLRYQTPSLPTSNSGRGELMNVKVRYKDPEAGESRLVEFPVVDKGTAFANATNDYRFASAVAAFGMALRESPYRGQFNLDRVLEIAENSRGRDKGGYRQEFIQLVRKAQSVDGAVPAKVASAPN
jgi:Ca-activated chloride channel homolog